MARKATVLTAVTLSLIPLGQSLLLGTIGIATATTAVVLHAPVAVAQNASSVARIAKAITVRIEGATQGSGVIVNKDGSRYTVLTAWHVVSGNRPGEELSISTPDGKNHELEQGSIQRLGEIDMAVLTFRSSGVYEVATIGDVNEIKHDHPIYVAGFPLNNSQNLSYEKGEMVANAEVGIDQGYQLLYDNQTFPGMSGGVLLNSDGELVGLHGRGEMREQSGAGIEINLKTGVNQGVPISYYLRFKDGETVATPKTKATTAQDYLAQALSSFNKRGREQATIRIVSQSISIQPTVIAYQISGYAKLIIKDFEGAVVDYNNAIKIDPQDFELYWLRGTAKHASEDYQGAISDYNISIKMKPKNSIAYYKRGMSNFKLKNYQEAFADYNKSIKINPNDANAYIRRGHSKKELNDHSGAIKDYNTAIRIDDKNPYAYNVRGDIKSESKDYQGAIADYTIAIAINPQLAEVYSNRGLAKSYSNDHQGAIADYNQAIKIDPILSNAYSGRGRSKALSKDYHGAITDFNTAISINPQHPDAYTGRGSAKAELKDYQGAIIDLDRQIMITPKDGAAYHNRAILNARFNNSKKACKDLIKAFSLGYDHKVYDCQYVFDGVSVKIKYEAYQDAISELNSIIAINPRVRNAYMLRGAMKFRIKDYLGAITDLDTAIIIDPKSKYSYFLRAEVKAEAGDLEGACNDTRKATSLGEKKYSAEQATKFCL